MCVSSVQSLSNVRLFVTSWTGARQASLSIINSLLLLLSCFSRVDSVQSRRQRPIRLPLPWESPSKNTGVGCHFLLQCMKVHPNSCPLSQWCYPTISPFVVPFFSCPQSFPGWGSFQMSQLFTSGGQTIGVSASASVIPMNIQDWFPLAWTGWISLQSKGLSRVFSNTTVQKHQTLTLGFRYSPTVTSIHDYWKNHRFPSIRVFSNETVFPIRWPKYWSSSFSISTFSEY